eukprot:7617541-Karenia_brevis.AAC.1
MLRCVSNVVPFSATSLARSRVNVPVRTIILSVASMAASASLVRVLRVTCLNDPHPQSIK